MATTAAVVLAKARQDLVSHFMSANAVSPDSAVGFEPARRAQRRMFERMQASGVIAESRPGTWYLDVPKYDEMTRNRRRRVGIAMAAIGIIGAVAAALG